MKHFSHLILGLIALFAAQSLHGQEIYEGMVYVRLNKANISHNTLYLEMDINIHGLKVNDSESLSLYVTLLNGSNSIRLAPVIVNGKKAQQKADRAILLNGSYEPQKGAYAVIKNDPAVHQVVVHRDSLDFRPWMSEAGLKLTGHVKDKNGTIVQTFEDILTTKISFADR